MDTEGFYMRPTLLIETSNNMKINREEVFGPIACVIKAEDYQDALSISNDTEFGLTSGIVTNSLKFANHFKRRSNSGITSSQITQNSSPIAIITLVW